MDVTHRLLISLDCLLDTRAGTLCLMDLHKTAKLMNSPLYACRLVAWCEGFDKDEFAKRYKARDRKTLSASMITRAYVILQDFLQRCYQRNLDTPHYLTPEIFVNFHPYDLTPEEEALILEGVRRKLPKAPTIRGVKLSDKEMTPVYLRDNHFTDVVIYDFNSWSETQSEFDQLKRDPIPSISFFAPALVERFDQKFPKNIAQFFEDWSTLFQMHVGVTFLPVDTFSSVLAILPKPHDPSAVESKDPISNEGFDTNWAG